MEFGQVHHLEYYVNDLKRSNEFWGWLLSGFGYNRAAEWESGVSWAHKNGTYLVFCQVNQEFLEAGNTRQGNGLNHIAFQGGSIADLDKLQKELEARQIKILQREGDYLCFEDPNNFAVEIYAS
jgi:catechol 2,3-dioxygenase-like lactoylglutathione lyase family enzyme